MVFPFRLWRFSGTINCPHCALANAGDEATREGHGPGSNLAEATPDDELPLEDPPQAARKRPKTAANGAMYTRCADRKRLLIPTSENMDEHCLAFGIVSRKSHLDRCGDDSQLRIRRPCIHSVKLHVLQLGNTVCVRGHRIREERCHDALRTCPCRRIRRHLDQEQRSMP